MSVWAGRPMLLAFVVTMIACSGGMQTAPSPLEVGGTWAGVVGSGSGGGRALRVSWSATQLGNSLAGPATILTSPPVTNVAFAGTMNGTLSGAQLSLSLVASPGSVTGSGACSVSATGSTSVASGTMFGTLDVTFVSCDGLDLAPPSSDQLTLTKQ